MNWQVQMTVSTQAELGAIPTGETIDLSDMSWQRHAAYIMATAIEQWLDSLLEWDDYE